VLVILISGILGPVLFFKILLFPVFVSVVFMLGPNLFPYVSLILLILIFILIFIH